MVRRWLVALILVGTAVCLPASYKIYLVDGKVITADDKPVIRDGIAFFQKSNLELYLPVDQIDLVKTEKGGALEVTPTGAAPSAKPATRVIGEDQLNDIRKRSRLANEGELRRPVSEEGAEGEKPAGGAAPAATGGDRSAMEGSLSGLISQRSDIQKRLVDLQSQMGSLRDRYDTATQQADKASLQGQIDGVQSQMDSARSQLSSVDASIQDTQQKLSSMPMVIER